MENVKNCIKRGYGKTKNFIGNHKCLLYGAYNTFGVSLYDIYMMNRVTNWGDYISSGEYGNYKWAFLGLRVAPIAINGIYNLIKQKKGEALKETMDLTETFLWTWPLQDSAYYAMKGINPISPKPENPYHFPFDYGDEPVAQFYGKHFALAGTYSSIKRRGKYVGRKIKEKISKK